MQNSLLNSLLAGNLRGDGCDQHCVASQPVRRLEKMSLISAERPANGGLLRIGHRSPGSDFGHSRSEIADSLRRIIEKLPFLGDCGRRPGSICTAWPSLQCNSPFSALASGKLGMPSRHCRAGGDWDLRSASLSSGPATCGLRVIGSCFVRPKYRNDTQTAAISDKSLHVHVHRF